MHDADGLMFRALANLREIVNGKVTENHFIATTWEINNCIVDSI